MNPPYHNHRGDEEAWQLHQADAAALVLLVGLCVLAVVAAGLILWMR